MTKKINFGGTSVSDSWGAKRASIIDGGLAKAMGDGPTYHITVSPGMNTGNVVPAGNVIRPSIEDAEAIARRLGATLGPNYKPGPVLKSPAQ